VTSPPAQPVTNSAQPVQQAGIPANLWGVLQGYQGKDTTLADIAADDNVWGDGKSSAPIANFAKVLQNSKDPSDPALMAAFQQALPDLGRYATAKGADKDNQADAQKILAAHTAPLASQPSATGTAPGASTRSLPIGPIAAALTGSALTTGPGTPVSGTGAGVPLGPIASGMTGAAPTTGPTATAPSTGGPTNPLAGIVQGYQEPDTSKWAETQQLTAAQQDQAAKIKAYQDAQTALGAIPPVSQPHHDWGTKDLIGAGLSILPALLAGGGKAEVAAIGGGLGGYTKAAAQNVDDSDYLEYQGKLNAAQAAVRNAALDLQNSQGNVASAQQRLNLRTQMDGLMQQEALKAQTAGQAEQAGILKQLGNIKPDKEGQYLPAFETALTAARLQGLQFSPQQENAITLLEHTLATSDDAAHNDFMQKGLAGLTTAQQRNVNNAIKDGQTYVQQWTQTHGGISDQDIPFLQAHLNDLASSYGVSPKTMPTLRAFQSVGGQVDASLINWRGAESAYLGGPRTANTIADTGLKQQQQQQVAANTRLTNLKAQSYPDLVKSQIANTWAAAQQKGGYNTIQGLQLMRQSYTAQLNAANNLKASIIYQNGGIPSPVTQQFDANDPNNAALVKQNSAAAEYASADADAKAATDQLNGLAKRGKELAKQQPSGNQPFNPGPPGSPGQTRRHQPPPLPGTVPQPGQPRVVNIFGGG
jgi:hypothetical protein